MTEVNFQKLIAKFGEHPARDEFQYLSYLVFCYKYGRQYGVFAKRTMTFVGAAMTTMLWALPLVDVSLPPVALSLVAHADTEVKTNEVVPPPVLP